MRLSARGAYGTHKNSMDNSHYEDRIITSDPTQEETDDSLQWYAVKTYSCREFVVAESFASQNIEHYLPVVKERRRWSDRVKTIHVPLFRNYLFARAGPLQEELWLIHNTRGVARILGNDNVPIPVTTEEINAVARILKSKTPIKIQYDIQPGQPVKIKSGPLQGLEGYFVKFKGKHCFAIHVSLLGQTVLAEVDCCDVEPN